MSDEINIAHFSFLYFFPFCYLLFAFYLMFICFFLVKRTTLIFRIIIQTSSLLFLPFVHDKSRVRLGKGKSS